MHFENVLRGPPSGPDEAFRENRGLIHEAYEVLAVIVAQDEHDVAGNGSCGKIPRNESGQAKPLCYVCMHR